MIFSTSSTHSTCRVLWCLFGGVCTATSKIIVVAIAKFRRTCDKNRGAKAARATHYLIFGDSSSKSVDIGGGVSTEWGDRRFPSIIVQGKNENL